MDQIFITTVAVTNTAERSVHSFITLHPWTCQ